MKKYLYLFIALIFLAPVSQAEKLPPLYQLSPKLVDGQTESLSKYQGKVILIVNTASRCGFTPQYEDLQVIYEKYRDQGFIVLAFPSNDFGEQEPGTNAEIAVFCEKKFDITFPVYEKNPVTNPGKQALFQLLTEGSEPQFQQEVKWNFEKFLLDRSGHLVERFPSIVKPTSLAITSKIESLLAQ